MIDQDDLPTIAYNLVPEEIAHGKGLLLLRDQTLEGSDENVSAPRGLKIIDYEVSEWPPDGPGLGIARRVWEFVRIARLPGGGESRDIWRLGPFCIKRWSPRDSATEVRLRCRVSREIAVCNRMWYVPWLHWTVARWIVGEAATHAECNQVLARFPGLRDLHPGNVVVGRRGAVVDFALWPTIIQATSASTAARLNRVRHCGDASAPQ